MKAIDIEWDIDRKKELEFLPKEIPIPDDMIQEDPDDYNDDISDYISDLTGYCHRGFKLVKEFSDNEKNNRKECQCNDAVRKSCNCSSKA